MFSRDGAAFRRIKVKEGPLNKENEGAGVSPGACAATGRGFMLNDYTTTKVLGALAAHS